MVIYPTLTRQAVIRPFQQTRAYNPALVSQKDDGTVVSRRKFTGNKHRWSLTHTQLPTADKALLETMQDDAGVSGDTISWVSPEQGDGATYIVRLADPIQFELEDHAAGSVSRWRAKFDFIED